MKMVVNGIKNSISVIASTQLEKKLERIDKTNLFIVELISTAIPDKSTFIEVMKKKFNLPESLGSNWDEYSDWMRDLSWFSDEINFLVIVHDYKYLLVEDTEKNKWNAIDLFQTFCEFWQEEVLHVVMNGKTRGFNVYLVD